MSDKKITPEDKLLKIIENPQDYKDSRRGLGVGAKKLFDLKVFKNIKVKDKFHVRFSLHLLNNIFIFLAASLTIFFVFNILSDKAGLEKQFDLISNFTVGEEAEDDKPFFQSKLSQILDYAKKRNMFTLVPVVAQNIEPEVSYEDVKTFVLVGVLWSAEPQVIIENSKDKRTYFLGVGEDIGEWKVKEIYKDGATLTSGDRKWDLK